MRLEDDSWVPRGTGLQLMQFNNPASTKNENKKYENSTLKKINQPVAFAARFTACPANLDYTRFPSHPARVRLLCAFANGASGYASTGRRLSQQKHR
jgi:hypothetical protein